MTAENAGGNRVKCTDPQPIGRAADHGGNAVAHFPRRLVGKRDRQNLVGPCPPGHQNMADTGRQNPGLAGSCSRQHQKRTIDGFDRIALRRIEPVEIGRGRRSRCGRTACRF